MLGFAVLGPKPLHALLAHVVRAKAVIQEAWDGKLE